MRLSHFEALQPICPRCRQEGNIDSPLSLCNVVKETSEFIFEGLLVCANSDCGMQYPIIHGIPIILSNYKQYLKNNFSQITMAHDLSPLIESVLSEAMGAGTELNNVKHHISSYGWDHYADLAPDNEFQHEENSAPPGSALRCLQAGLDLLPHQPQEPIIDMGCALGRTSFELAKQSKSLTLGVDINFWKLRIAQKVLQEGVVAFPLKTLGIAYENHTYEVELQDKDKVDFWVCNAMSLPFSNKRFQFASALNVFDVIPNPKKLLASIARILDSQGTSIISTPYDWAPPVPMENWLGGRGIYQPHGGDSEAIMRDLLQGRQYPLKIIGENPHHTWHVRIHRRRTASYDTHILALQKS